MARPSALTFSGTKGPLLEGAGLGVELELGPAEAAAPGEAGVALSSRHAGRTLAKPQITQTVPRMRCTTPAG
jgi:hypothetical protein